MGGVGACHFLWLLPCLLGGFCCTPQRATGENKARVQPFDGNLRWRFCRLPKNSGGKQEGGWGDVGPGLPRLDRQRGQIVAPRVGGGLREMGKFVLCAYLEGRIFPRGGPPTKVLRQGPLEFEGCLPILRTGRFLQCCQTTCFYPKPVGRRPNQKRSPGGLLFAGRFPGAKKNATAWETISGARRRSRKKQGGTTAAAVGGVPPFFQEKGPSRIFESRTAKTIGLRLAQFVCLPIERGKGGKGGPRGPIFPGRWGTGGVR